MYADGALPLWALLGEYDNGTSQGQGRSEYIWLPSDDGGAIPIGMYRNGRLYAVHTDHLGTPRLMTDEHNTPVWQWAYSAFGNNRPTGILKTRAEDGGHGANGATKASRPAVQINLRLPGQYFDAESNLSYNYLRNYDGRTGRYTQADPIGLEGGINRFGYVGGSPLMAIDPFGLDWEYSSSTGLLSHNGSPVATGYAGNGAGLNNPSMQNVPNTGPLPQGEYQLGPQYNNPKTGPGTMNLTPDPANDMYGRSAFRIHGDNARGNFSASEGCVILPRNVRNQIDASPDKRLRVSP